MNHSAMAQEVIRILCQPVCGIRISVNVINVYMQSDKYIDKEDRQPVKPSQKIPEVGSGAGIPKPSDQPTNIDNDQSGDWYGKNGILGDKAEKYIRDSANIEDLPGDDKEDELIIEETDDDIEVEDEADIINDETVNDHDIADSDDMDEDENIDDDIL
jgi:hypothetical protein